MKIFDLDIKALLVFDTIMKKGSRQLAADSLNINLSKVHYYLQKLRKATNDTLFERERDRLIPTPHAISLHRHVQKALQALDQGFQESMMFDYTSDKKHFVILCNDYFAEKFAHHLLERLEEFAQKITLDFEIVPDTGHPQSPIDHFNYYEMLLTSEKAALSISAHANIYNSDKFKRKRIYRDVYANIFSQENFDAVDHAEQPIQMNQESANYLNSISNFSTLISTIKNSLYVSKVPMGMLASYEAELNIEQTQEQYDLFQYWHVNHDAKPDHRWLRKFISSTCNGF